MDNFSLNSICLLWKWHDEELVFKIAYRFVESEVKLQRAHQVFDFSLGYSFSDLGDTTKCWHHHFLALIAFTSSIHSKHT